MQMVKDTCTSCGGDGLRQQVGVLVPLGAWKYSNFPRCTRCKGSGMEPKAQGRRTYRPCLTRGGLTGERLVEFTEANKIKDTQTMEPRGVDSGDIIPEGDVEGPDTEGEHHGPT